MNVQSVLSFSGVAEDSQLLKWKPPILFISLPNFNCILHHVVVLQHRCPRNVQPAVYLFEIGLLFVVLEQVFMSCAHIVNMLVCTLLKCSSG